MTDVSSRCSVCAGSEPVTPQSVANMPGQPTLRYRVGTHSAFMETMWARLSALPELSGLTARDSSDAAIALLDGWACVADVLSFYQERIANEGYLRTATERYSLVEIGRLVNYKPRPGVAASAFLAYQMEAGYRGIVPLGTRAQSLPGQNQLPQSFETSEQIEARAEWNNLAPRRFRPQRLDEFNAHYIGNIYLEGITTNLNAGDPLLLVWGKGDGEQILRTVAKAMVNPQSSTTQVTLITVLGVKPFFAALTDISEHFLPEIKALASAAPHSEWQMELQTLTVLLENLTRAWNEATNIQQLETPASAYHAYLEKLDAERKSTLADQVPPGRDELLDELMRLNRSLDTHSDTGARLALILQAEPKPTEGNTLTTTTAETAPYLSDVFRGIAAVSRRMRVAPAQPPATAFSQAQSIQGSAGHQAQIGARLLLNFATGDKAALFSAFAKSGIGVSNESSTKQPRPAQVFALRVTAALFGHNAPPRFKMQENVMTPVDEDWPCAGDDAGETGRKTLFLEREFPELQSGDWAVVRTDPVLPQQSNSATNNLATNNVATSNPATSNPPNQGTQQDDGLRYALLRDVRSGISRAAYNISGKTTSLSIVPPDAPSQIWHWRNPRNQQAPSPGTEFSENRLNDFSSIRRTVVHTKSERLALAQEPISMPVSGDQITLNEVCEGLVPGRRVIVAGERADLFGAENVRAAEVVMIVGIAQEPDPYRTGDTPHTVLTLSPPLAYLYKRETALVHGNVARATNGETRSEILGSGNAATALQRFTLRQNPLTYVSSPTPSGIESTLQVFVNDVRWHESPTLNRAAPDEHTFATTDDEKGETTLYFGDGERGARLPTGQENVRAVYRTGIGQPGNVSAGAITQLAARPLGVKSVVNPTAASGGAGAETPETMRQHIPLSLASLERLISESDYAAFSRVFAGVAKASAARLTDGRRNILQVTIAAEGDAPLDTSGDLLNNLKTALRRYGDPTVALSVQAREKVVAVIGAKIKVLPEYLWESVAPAVQTALRAAFAFERRGLAQTLFPSEVLAVIQSVPGVDYVDLDMFLGVYESKAADAGFLQKFFAQASETTPRQSAPILAQPARPGVGKLLPAQLVYLDADLPETLILNQIL